MNIIDLINCVHDNVKQVNVNKNNGDRSSDTENSNIVTNLENRTRLKSPDSNQMMHFKCRILLKVDSIFKVIDKQGLHAKVDVESIN